MEQADQKLLQMCYAGALVDAANNYAILEGTGKIEAKKVREQRAAAAQQLGRFGAKTPAEVLTRMKEVFGCTEWRIEEETELATRAVSASCLMCAIAKRSGAASPCKLFCINPMAAYAEALEPGYTFTAQETLWEGNECRFVFERR
jgi:hypothetical protein